MLIDLEKQDLINLVKGIAPSFTAMNEPYIKGMGYYDDYRGSWKWYNTSLEQLDENDLLLIYYLCKNSWN
jgi:hypothetical protein|nr:MAG TPA: hypothetical protein [Caudoviricetes sp.]